MDGDILDAVIKLLGHYKVCGLCPTTPLHGVLHPTLYEEITASITRNRQSQLDSKVISNIHDCTISAPSLNNATSSSSGVSVLTQDGTCNLPSVSNGEQQEFDAISLISVSSTSDISEVGDLYSELSSSIIPTFISSLSENYALSVDDIAADSTDTDTSVISNFLPTLDHESDFTFCRDVRETENLCPNVDNSRKLFKSMTHSHKRGPTERVVSNETVRQRPSFGRSAIRNALMSDTNYPIPELPALIDVTLSDISIKSVQSDGSLNSVNQSDFSNLPHNQSSLSSALSNISCNSSDSPAPHQKHVIVSYNLCK